MQGRIAGQALTRAGKEADDGFSPVRHPQRKPVTADKATRPEIGAGSIDPAPQLRPAQRAPPVLQGDGQRALGGVARQQGIEGVGAPAALLVVAQRLGRMV